MSARTRVACVVGVAALSLAVAVAPASAGKNGPNNDSAKKCQSYLDWMGADGSVFASSDECTAYAARGGQLVAKPPVLSDGCNLLNDSFNDGRYLAGGINSTSVNAGETITVMASNPDAGATGVVLSVDGVDVDSSLTLPATLTYTFPSSGMPSVAWSLIGSGSVDWQVSCS